MIEAIESINNKIELLKDRREAAARAGCNIQYQKITYALGVLDDLLEELNRT